MVDDPIARFDRMREAAIRAGAGYCSVCGQVLGWQHDHKPDQSGIDDGPWLPGRAPRKRPAPKPADEVSATRKRAWATRRAKYGQSGHR